MHTTDLSAQTTWHNWAGQFSCSPRHVHRPQDATALADALGRVRDAGGRARIFGSGHSPSDVAMSDDHLILLHAFDRVLHVDPDRRRVRAQGNVRLDDLARCLTMFGLALPNLGSIAEQTLAGAMATATHGTGLTYGVMPTWIRGTELMTAQGEREWIDEDDPRLPGVSCSLGALGVHLAFELEVAPAFDLAVEEGPVALDVAMERLEDRLQEDHYRLWLFPHCHQSWEWRASRLPPGPGARPSLTWRDRLTAWGRERLIGYYLFEALLRVGVGAPALVPAINRWYRRTLFSSARTSRGDAFDQFTFDCLFKQYVDEWAIPVAHTQAAIAALLKTIAQNSYKVHLPIEVRFVAGDEIWMSPCYQQDSCYIGIIAYMPYGATPEHEAYFADYEHIMTRFGGRPHWAKRFGLQAADLAPRYPRWADFQALRDTLDPERRFANAYTDRVLG
ncbi:MAG: D-arabinono-1,4-lactone oxidase [Myxococcota bacterium]